MESHAAEVAQWSAMANRAREPEPSTQSARGRAETGRSSRFPIVRRSSTRGSYAAAPGGDRLGEGHPQVGAQAPLGALWERVSGSSSAWSLEEEAGLPQKASFGLSVTATAWRHPKGWN